MWRQGSTLIIDDRIEDGTPISKELQALCIPHLFFHADEENIRLFDENRLDKLQRVRVIFQDINLTGGTAPSTKDYDVAATILDKLLELNNGPWLLVTWSTWAEENNAEHAEKLFLHLRKELPKDKRPYSFVVAAKSDFTKARHGEVTKHEEMDTELRKNFGNALKAAVKTTPAMDALMHWEKTISHAVGNTLASLHSLSDHQKDHDQRLGKLLYELAKAEAGKSLNTENAWHSLARILNNQLTDSFSESVKSATDIIQFSTVNSWQDVKEWKRRVNKLLHFDTLSECEGPGTIYTYSSYLKMVGYCHKPVSVVLPGTPVRIEEKQKIIGEKALVSVFLKTIDNSSTTNDETLKNNLKAHIQCDDLIIVDVTPSCDHAQNKQEWSKFCVGMILDITKVEKNYRDDFLKIFKEPQYLWTSCEFSLSSKENEANQNIMVFNSRLIISLPHSAEAKSILSHAKIRKMREQINRDLTHWLAQQLSRPGYSYMS